MAHSTNVSKVFGNGHTQRKAVQDATHNIVMAVHKLVNSQLEFEQDVISEFEIGSAVSQVLPFRYKDNHLHNALTVFINYGDDLFRQFWVEGKKLTEANSLQLLGVIGASVMVAQVAPSERFNEARQLSGKAKKVLLDNGVKVTTKKSKGSDGASTRMVVTDLLLPLVEQCKKDLEVIVSMTVSDTYKEPSKEPASPRLQIVCSAGCEVAEKKVRISVSEEFLSVIGRSLGTCGSCNHPFQSVASYEATKDDYKVLDDANKTIETLV